jgi:hypothetical protein
LLEAGGVVDAHEAAVMGQDTNVCAMQGYVDDQVLKTVPAGFWTWYNFCMSDKREHKLEPYLISRYVMDGKFDMPTLEKQAVDLHNLKLIRFSDVIKNETKDKDATVHFFIYDDEFDEVWRKPEGYVKELGQYKQVITTDFSLYTNMSLAMQIFNTYRNRWLGCFWQEKGLTVIPSVGWSDEWSYEFCFDGIQEGAIVALSTLGSYDIEPVYMDGFRQMCEKLKPEAVICYAKPFDSMLDLANVIEIPYVADARIAPMNETLL